MIEKNDFLDDDDELLKIEELVQEYELDKDLAPWHKPNVYWDLFSNE